MESMAGLSLDLKCASSWTIAARKAGSMKMLMASLLMAVIPLGSSAGAERYACNMRALTKSERATYEQLTRTVRGSVEERQELENGYAFRLPASRLVEAARW